MILLRFEWKKTLGRRFLLLTLCVLAFVSAVASYYETVEILPKGCTRSNTDDILRFLEISYSDPDAFSELFKTMNDESVKHHMEILEEENRKMIESELGIAYASDDDPDIYDTFTFCDTISNEKVREIYYGAKENADRFKARTAGILAQATENAIYLRDDEGMDLSDYEYYYQVHAYRTYERLCKETTVNSTAAFGWEQYFACKYTDLLIFAALMLYASEIFLLERKRGMLQIVSACKNGRMKTAAAKVGSVVLGAAAITLLLSAASLLGVRLATGFSPLSLPVQTIPALFLYPKTCTVGQYLVYHTLLRLLAAVCFALFVTVFSLLTRSSLLSFILGGAVFGGSVYLNSLSPYVQTFLQSMNLFSFMRVEPVTASLRSYSLFGRCVDCLYSAPVIGILLALLLSVSALFASLLFLRKSGGARRSVLFARFKRFWEIAREKVWSLTEKRRSRNSLSVVKNELIKLTRKRIAVFLLLILLLPGTLLIAGIDRATYETPRYYRIYELYFLPLVEGKTSEKMGVYADELNIYLMLSEEMKKADNMHKNGEMSDEEYEKLGKKAEEIVLKSLNVGINENKMLFNKFIKANTESGKDPWFIDYEGWMRFFSARDYYLLYALLLILGAVSFAMEYEGVGNTGGFAMILRSSRFGRRKTFLAKYIVAVGLGLAGALFTLGVRCAFLLPECNFSCLDAPLCSVPGFLGAAQGLTIGEYLLFSSFAWLLAVPLFAVFAVSVSALVKNDVNALITIILPTLLPTVAAFLKVSHSEYINFGGWLGVGDMMRVSVDVNLFGSGFGLYLLYSAVFFAVTCILTAAARRKFVK